MKVYIRFALLSLLTCIFYNCALPSDDEENSDNEDYSSELPWNGETNKFTINAKEGIRLKDPNEEAGTAYVSTPSTNARNTRWEFGVRLTFNPSANNYARFYLTSSSDILSGALKGYFIQIGGAKDNVALYRQDENQAYLLASGRELMKGNNSPKIFVKVECDNNGYWTFWTRLETDTEYTKEKQIKDTQFTNSVCSGIYCVYTKSRCDGFTFHHIAISNDVEINTKPEEKPEEPEKPETPDNPDSSELPEDVRGMLLFNEIMYDCASDGTEYIEIYNPTEKKISLSALYLYKMYSNGTVYNTTVLQHEDSSIPVSIPAKGYLCFTKSISTVVIKHKVDAKNIMGISKFPSLNNEGGYLALSTSKEPGKGKTFDTCRFKDTMHDNTKVTKGISLEKKSPDMPSLNVNWHSSSDSSGGTPGIKNSSKDTNL